ncbi:hypothetical protein [Nocardia sp. NPDC052566]|uniref:hypothetical protein n=1 Tax=Nocardia sp. NPDC052566 TaxID=3364330 RepID=UPI0037C5640D
MTPTTSLPTYSLVSQTSASEHETFPGCYSDLAAAWRSAAWRNARYPGTCTYVIDTRTGERAPRSGAHERPIFESDADIESYYRVWDDDETTLYRTF